MIKSFEHDDETQTVSAEIIAGDLHCFINLTCDEEWLDLSEQLRRLLEKEEALAKQPA